MAPTDPLLLLLCFFTFTISLQSRSDLHPSDHNALLHIQRDMGIPPAENRCSSAGIFCQENSDIIRVTHLVFESQHLKGKLSSLIGQLSELQELSLKNNQLTDQIPPQIINCQKLEVLNLGNNRFSGEIRDKFSSLIRLRVLDLSSNRFTGDLKFLQHLPNLEKLNLADNNFAGKVPVCLNSFRKLKFVDFSGNSLVDNQVDQYLSTGRYIFAETSQGSRNQSTTTAMAPSLSRSVAPKKSKNTAVKWIVGLLFGVLSGSVSGLVFSMVLKLLMRLIRGNRTDTSLKIFSPMIKKPEDLAFLEKEDGLASLAIIGRGGCGEVYKAVLPGSDGKEIAIKKIIPAPSDGEDLAEDDSKLLNRKMRQIRSEIQTVGQIRHRNLLPLLAHLPRSNCHYLIYEYMKNGSLQDYLKDVEEGRRELDWLTRHKIALGVASGLEYLHMSHRPRIIHRDLKPANVLLDDEMEARIADFGLAKAMPDANTHITTSNVAGTVGYIAPEYYQTFQFTDKCDVYSFGVLLAVLVTGKMPSDEFYVNTEEMSLVKWMRSWMSSENPRRAIDPKLLGNGYVDQMLLVLKVACFCTLDNPSERPNSTDARCMLSQIQY